MSKMPKGMQRMFTGLLAAAMVLTSMPVAAFAEEAPKDEGQFVVEETAEADSSAEEVILEETENPEEDAVLEAAPEETSEEAGDSAEELLGNSDKEVVITNIEDLKASDWLNIVLDDNVGKFFIQYDNQSFSLKLTSKNPEKVVIKDVTTDSTECEVNFDSTTGMVTVTLKEGVDKFTTGVTLTVELEKKDCTVTFSYDDTLVSVTAVGLADKKVVVPYDNNLTFKANTTNDEYELDSVTINDVAIDLPIPVDGYAIKNITEDKTVVITAKELGYDVTLDYNDGQVVVSEMDPAPGADGIVKVDKGGSFTFKAEAEPGFQITSITCNEDEIPVEEDNVYEFTDIQQNKDIIINSIEVVPVTFTLNGAKLYAYDAESGKGLEIELSEDGILNVEKEKDFLFCLEAPDADSTIASVKAGTTALKAASGADDCTYYTIPAKSLKKAAAVTVTSKSSKITSVSLKGFKNNAIAQAPGTTVEYPITINKDGDINRLKVKASSRYATVAIDYEAKKLIVTNSYVDTYYDPDIKNVLVGNFDFEIQFYDKAIADENKIGEAFTIKPADVKIAKPTVKVTKVSDIAVDLSLTAPKNCPENTYFEIIAKAKASVAGMKDQVTEYVPADQTEATILLSDLEQGKGAAAKYDITVNMIQTQWFTLPDGDPEHDVQDERIVGRGAVAKLSTATLAPGYEVKLALTKKQTTFTAGETDITLAVAKYSAKTTFRSIARAVIVDAYGDTVNSGTSGSPLVIDGDEIKLAGKYEDLFSPGKATLYVYPSLPDGTYGTPATTPLTIKMPIWNVDVNIPSKSVYFDGKKKVSFKASTVLNYGSKEAAPASKKVTWEVGSIDDDDNFIPAPDTITVKNGTVSIAKNYVLNDDPLKNTFVVVAAAADFAGNEEVGVESFTITDEKLSIGSVEIGVVKKWDEAVNSVALIGQAINVYNEPAEGDAAELLDPADYTLKVSDAKNFVIEDGMITDIKKAGKFTLTVTATDGGKASFKQVIEIAPAEATEYDFAAYEYAPNSSYDLESNSNYDEMTLNEGAFTPTNGYGYYLLKSEVSKTAPTVLIYADSFKLKNAKMVADWVDGYVHYQVIKADSEKDITVTHAYKILQKAESKEYTIKNPLGNDTKIKAGKGEKLQFYANSDGIAYEFKFDFGKHEISDSTKAQIKFFPAEDALKNADVYNFAGVLNAPGSIGFNDKVWTVSYAAGKLDGFAKGNYKVYAALYDDTDGVKKFVTPLTAFTFKAVAAKKPTATNAVTAKKPLKLEDTNNAFVEIPIKQTNSLGYYKYALLMNNNHAGTVNDFAKYFTVVRGYVDDGGELREADGVKATGLYLKRNSVEGYTPDDLNGWVGYVIIGEDGSTEAEFTDHIYVELTDGE